MRNGSECSGGSGPRAGGRLPWFPANAARELGVAARCATCGRRRRDRGCRVAGVWSTQGEGAGGSAGARVSAGRKKRYSPVDWDRSKSNASPRRGLGGEHGRSEAVHSRGARLPQAGINFYESRRCSRTRGAAHDGRPFVWMFATSRSTRWLPSSPAASFRPIVAYDLNAALRAVPSRASSRTRRSAVLRLEYGSDSVESTRRGQAGGARPDRGRLCDRRHRTRRGQAGESLAAWSPAGFIIELTSSRAGEAEDYKVESSSSIEG